MWARNIKNELRAQFKWRIKQASGMVFDSLHGVDTSGSSIANLADNPANSAAEK